MEGAADHVRERVRVHVGAAACAVCADAALPAFVATVAMGGWIAGHVQDTGVNKLCSPSDLSVLAGVAQASYKSNVNPGGERALARAPTTLSERRQDTVLHVPGLARVAVSCNAHGTT